MGAALFFLITVSGQKFKNVERTQFKINFISPGVEFEKGLGNNTTLLVGANVQFYTRITQKNEVWSFIPGANTEFRYYTNLNRRILKNKEIAGNSGNYVSLKNSTYVIVETIYDSADLEGGVYGHFGPTYGIQRTYLRGFNFNIQLGFGYYYDQKYDGFFAPIGGFSVGWVF